MKQQLRQEVKHVFDELIELISSVDDQLINIVPFEGSWTAGELAKHMIMSNGGFVEMMAGDVEETNRQPGEKVDDIRSTFLNFSIKFESPEFIQPPKVNYRKQDLIQELSEIQRNLDGIIESSDLNKTCAMFELPVLGYLTQLEAAHFVLYHTQRHVHQLKNIVSKLSSQNNLAARKQSVV
jgi:DinB superfamily